MSPGSTPSLTSSRIAVKIIFFLNGFVHANYYSRLPRIQDLFKIDNGTLGFVLLSSSLGAILAMPFTGWLIIRNGSRRISLVSVYFYCVMVPFIPVELGLGFLLFVFFLLGVSSGMMDVSMNSQAVIVEQRLGKPIMTSFHAFFSIGMMLGALTGSLFSKISTGLNLHLTSIAVVGVVVIFAASRYLLQDKPEKTQDDGPAFRLPNSAMVSIGIIAFCCMLGEGAMADWSTNYMENVAMASKTIAPLGLSAFAMSMTIGRLLGDGARVRFGDKRLMVICGIIASAGLVILVNFSDPFVMIAGFFIVGLGLSAVVPITYSLAGNAKGLPPGVGLAMVTTVGYSGFLFGPPIIGFLADLFTLRYALLLVLLLFVTMTILGFRYKSESKI